MDSVIPINPAGQILDIPPNDEEVESLTVVIVRKGERYAGLVVDNLLGQRKS